MQKWFSGDMIVRMIEKIRYNGYNILGYAVFGFVYSSLAYVTFMAFLACKSGISLLWLKGWLKQRYHLNQVIWLQSSHTAKGWWEIKLLPLRWKTQV